MSWDVASNLLAIWTLGLGGPEFISEGHVYRLINLRHGRLSAALECSSGPVTLEFLCSPFLLVPSFLPSLVSLQEKHVPAKKGSLENIYFLIYYKSWLPLHFLLKLQFYDDEF
jgi:hypothetical protein